MEIEHRFVKITLGDGSTAWVNVAPIAKGAT